MDSMDLIGGRMPQKGQKSSTALCHNVSHVFCFLRWHHASAKGRQKAGNFSAELLNQLEDFIKPNVGSF